MSKKITVVSWKTNCTLNVDLSFPESGKRPSDLVSELYDKITHYPDGELRIGTYSPLIALIAETACNECNAEFACELDGETVPKNILLAYLTEEFIKLEAKKDVNDPAASGWGLRVI